MSGVTSTGKKQAVGILLGLALFVGFPSSSSADETSYRAVANGPALHLTALHILPPISGTDKWTVSGFAPGIGTFSQSVGPKDISIDYGGGTASLTTNVTTSLGLAISISVKWNNPSLPEEHTQTVSIPNPPGTLTIKFKRAASVTGNIGAFTIGAGVTGDVSYRTVTP